jgi:hypothetical protein
MIEHHPFGDGLQKHRLAGARWSHDQSALTESDRRDEIDHSTRHLWTRLGGTPGLQLELALGIRRRECGELRTACRGRRIVVIDLLYFDDYGPIAMIAADCRADFIAATEGQWSDQMRRYVRITRLGEVTELRPANEARVSLRIEPTSELSLCYDRCRWLLWAMLASRTAAAALMACVASATLSTRIVITALSSAPISAAAPAPARALLILLAHGRLRRSSYWTGAVIGAVRSGSLAIVRALFCGWWRLKWNGGRRRRLWRRTYAVGVSIVPRVFVLL